MGIGGHTARFLAAEHRYKPLPSVMHLLGRQTIHSTMEEVRGILASEGVVACEVIEEIDEHTLEGRHALENGSRPMLSDKTFFEMFGVKRLSAIDHSSYEGADLVFDLTREAPKQHWGIADAIFDGSVMDNVFGASEAMHNVVRLLKPGGRYIGIAMGCTKLGAYIGFNPYWFFDFFVMNRFRDVRVYVWEYFPYVGKPSYADSAVYMLDPHADHRSAMQFVGGNGVVALFVIAEKDEESTSHCRASQAIYRLEDEWRVFDENLERIRNSDRPVISLRKHTDRLELGGYGFNYVGNLTAFGNEQRDPRWIYPLCARGEIDVGMPFAGFDWGAREQDAQGRAWRWLGEASRPAVLIVNLPRNVDFMIEVVIHSAPDARALEAFEILAETSVLETVSRGWQSDECLVIAKLPARLVTSSALQIGFRSAFTSLTSGSRAVALSKVRLYAADETSSRTPFSSIAEGAREHSASPAEADAARTLATERDYWKSLYHRVRSVEETKSKDLLAFVAARVSTRLRNLTRKI
jgi:hypothetical protein